MQQKGNINLSRPLVVGSWPGTGSEYVHRFCESLAINGISVKGVKWPWECFGERVDVLQLHWLDQAIGEVSPLVEILRTIAVVITLAILRLRGVKLVWCVHDLVPHDSRRRTLIFWRIYTGLVGRLVNGVITLSPSTLAIARTHFASLTKKPGIFVWHPAYLIPCLPSKGPTWRERHGIEQHMTVLVFFGAVRLYKGLEELIAAFKKISDPNFRLVIAGRVGKEKLRPILGREAVQDPRIILDLRWLSEEDLAELVLAADVVVLPYTQIFHSGSLIYGLSCDKSVITPETGYANDIRGHVGPQWIRTYQPPLSASVLSSLCGRSTGHPDLDFLSVQMSGAKLKEFYLRLLSKGADA